MTKRTVTQELELQRKLRADLDAIGDQIRPLELRADKICRQLEASRKRIACKKVPNCRGFIGHLGCHNT